VTILAATTDAELAQCAQVWFLVLLSLACFLDIMEIIIDLHRFFKPGGPF
jgi:hypothetical protein